MTHTKGPWTHDKDYVYKKGDRNHLVCALLHYPGYLDNARLIATAPDLLEALELIKRCDDKGFINLKPGWSRVVNNAIRKAKS